MVTGTGGSREGASYDALPYPALSYSQTHPDRLATVATLLGMSPAPLDRCRVLEVGCAVGGNLLPMAYGLPDAEFVGIDVSAGQIAEGQAAVVALGLPNVTLHHLDLVDAGPSLGQFDYIMAHGIYSWVPPAVRDRLLALCKERLAPNGVAYVSYNTLPGWHMIRIVRDMMLYRTRDVADPRIRAQEGRALLNFMAEACPGVDNAYASFLKMYAGLLDDKLADGRGRNDSLLLHDEMEEINDPVYFHQFAAHAAAHGLQYLGEAKFHTMTGSTLPPAVQKELAARSTSVIDVEQYLDFLHNRTFRETLLCHQEVSLSRAVQPEALRRLYVASHAQPTDAHVDLGSSAVVKFQASDGAVLSTDHPVSKAAVMILAERWPTAVRFDDLLPAARARLSRGRRGAPEQGGGAGAGTDNLDVRVLASNLLSAYGYSDSLVELHAWAPRLVLKPSGRPAVSAVARFQAQTDGRVTNLRHERVKLDELDRFLVAQLDGSRDRPALIDALIAGPVAQGLLTLRDDAPPAPSPKAAGREMREILAGEIENRLAWLAGAALLVA